MLYRSVSGRSRHHDNICFRNGSFLMKQMLIGALAQKYTYGKYLQCAMLLHIPAIDKDSYTFITALHHLTGGTS